MLDGVNNMKLVKRLAIFFLFATVGLFVLRLLLFAIIAGILAVIGFVALFIFGAVAEHVDKK